MRLTIVTLITFAAVIITAEMGATVPFSGETKDMPMMIDDFGRLSNAEQQVDEMQSSRLNEEVLTEGWDSADPNYKWGSLEGGSEGLPDQTLLDLALKSLYQTLVYAKSAKRSGPRRNHNGINSFGKRIPSEIGSNFEKEEGSDKENEIESLMSRLETESHETNSNDDEGLGGYNYSPLANFIKRQRAGSRNLNNGLNYGKRGSRPNHSGSSQSKEQSYGAMVFGKRR